MQNCIYLPRFTHILLSCCEPFTLWFEAIGAWAHQKSQHQIVGFDPTTGGAILAFDGQVTPRWLVGGGMAYLYTHIHERKDQGHSNINQEDAFVYSSWDNQRFYVDMLVMGGAMQIHQVRNTTMTGFSFRSSSHPHGWQLLPHLELGLKLFKTCHFYPSTRENPVLQVWDESRLLLVIRLPYYTVPTFVQAQTRSVKALLTWLSE